MDPFEGRIFDPATLHRYLYAAADPVQKVDPTGRDFSFVQTLTVAVIIGVLATNALLQPRTFTEGVKATFYGIALGLAAGLGWYYLAGATTVTAVTAPPIVLNTGDIIIRQYRINGEVIEVAGEVTVEGSKLVVRGLMVYAQGAPRAYIGMRGVLQAREMLATEARDLGFKTLELFGHRTLGSSSANPGHQIHVIIDLTSHGG